MGKYTDFEKYITIFRRGEKNLAKFLKKKMLSYGYKTVLGQDFLYCPGTIPIMLVAHIDTVHKKKPKPKIIFDKDQGILWSPQGLGADDRAGVCGILEILERGYRPYVLFTDKEEKGGVGAKEASKAVRPPKKVKYIIELDRKNGNDAVFYQDDNKEFQDYIVKNYEYSKAYGSFSDISCLCPAWGISGVNLSIGYYEQHSKTEHLQLDEWYRTISQLELMLTNVPKKRFKYKEAPKPKVYTGGWGNGWVMCYGGGSYTNNYSNKQKKADKTGKSGGKSNPCGVPNGRRSISSSSGSDGDWLHYELKYPANHVDPGAGEYLPKLLSRAFGGSESTWILWLIEQKDYIEEHLKDIVFWLAEEETHFYKDMLSGIEEDENGKEG